MENKQKSLGEIAELIVRAIQDEPYFTKDVLIPKIRALIKSFRVDLSPIELNELDVKNMKSRIERLHSAISRAEKEKVFWVTEIKKIVSEEEMEQYYKKRNEQLNTHTDEK